MSSSLTSSLNIALKALQSNQSAIYNTSHNIANINTVGYKRQSTIFGSESANGAGAGVNIDSIIRVVDNFLVEKTTSQLATSAYSEAFSGVLSSLELIFGSPNSDSNMEKLVNNMFSELNNLAANPNSSAQRVNVIKSIEAVVDNFNDMNTALTAEQISVDRQIDAELININAALKAIYSLNVEIAALKIASEQNGAINSNDLQDERQRQIDIIAESFDVRVSYGDNGAAVVQTFSGRALVSTNSYGQLERTTPAPGETYQGIGLRTFLSDGVTPSNNVLEVGVNASKKGRIAAFVDARDTTIPTLIAQLDEFAAATISAINNVHSQGSGVPAPNSLTSGNGANISALGADLMDANELNLTPSTSFDISIIDTATGAPIVTTLAAGGGTTSIAIPAGGPFTLADLANLINTNPDIGADVTATVASDANGLPSITITANNASYSVVLANNTGNPLGELGMNNLFTSDSVDASSMAIRSDILNDSSLLATARMRASDGGLSALDNQNAVALAAVADASQSFSAAGGLPSQNSTLSGYYITISSNFAVLVSSTEKEVEFNEILLADLQNREASVSGVDINEELSNLIVFQNAFQAGARITSVVDELYEALLGMVR